MKHPRLFWMANGFFAFLAVLVFVLPALFPPHRKPPADDQSCHGPFALHVLVGRDEYWIPTRQGPNLDADEGETRIRTQIKGPEGHRFSVYCQRPDDPPWRVRWVGVQIRNVIPIAVPHQPGDGLQELIVVSLLRRDPRFKIGNFEWFPSQGPYWVGNQGRDFYSKEGIFLGSRLAITTTPGSVAAIRSPIGQDTLATAMTYSHPQKNIPSDQTIAAMAQLITDWKRPK